MGYDDIGGKDEANLRQAKLEAEVEKLKLEAELLKAQTSKRHRRIELLKALSGLGGVVVTLSAVVGGTFSVVQWLTSEHETRLENSEKRLDQALANLAAKDNPALQLSAINSLRSFMHMNLEPSVEWPWTKAANNKSLTSEAEAANASNSAQASATQSSASSAAASSSMSSQSSAGASSASSTWIGVEPLPESQIVGDKTMQTEVMSALAMALISTEDENVQNAIVDFIREEASSTHAPAREACMKALVNSNRDRFKSLAKSHKFGEIDMDRADPLPTAAPIFDDGKNVFRDDPTLISLHKAIQVLLPLTTYSDFRGAFLDHMNFSFTKREHARFTHAVLDNANFRYSSYPGADFTDADLIDTDFFHADLHKSKFMYKIVSDDTDINIKVPYLIRDIYYQSVFIKNEIDYQKHQSKNKEKDEIDYSYALKLPYFNGANLDDTDFYGSILAGYTLTDPKNPRYPTMSFLRHTFNGASVNHASMNYIKIITIDTTKNYKDILFSGPITDRMHSIWPYSFNYELKAYDPFLNSGLSLISVRPIGTNISTYKDYRGLQSLHELKNWASASSWPQGIRAILADLDKEDSQKKSAVAPKP